LFWHQVKSIFLNNISLFVALFILAIALALYFPSLGQEDRLAENRDALEKESLQITEELAEDLLLRDDLLGRTQGLDFQLETWEKRTATLKGYLEELSDE